MDTILIVDDEDAIRSALKTFLSRLGYRVLEANTGESALNLAEAEDPDLILLDVVLDESDPDQMSGIEVCRQLRQRPRFVPIIMLTSYPEWQVESLGQGAIAFITKPWDNNALASQIRTTLGAVEHIRREQSAQGNVINVYSDIVIDLDQFRVKRGQEDIDLTPIEFALLTFLAKNPNRQWSREALLDRVWGVEWAGYPRTVDRHIAAVRRKLGLQRDEMIETIHGIGYRLVRS